MSDELKTCGAAGPNGAECDLEPHDFGMHRGWDQMGKRFDWGPHKSEFQHSPEPWNVVQTLGGDWYLTDCEDDYPVVVATPSLPDVPTDSVPEPTKTPAKKRGRRKLYTKRAKAGRRSRAKGAAHELALAQIARDNGFPRARRSAPLQAGERATDTGRKKEPDVDGIPLLWVEGKHEKRASPRAYAREYLRERPGFIPVVCWRAQGMGPDETVAELKFTDLLKLLRAATERGETHPLGTPVSAVKEPA